MIKRTVKIGLGSGLHVRAVAMLVQIANQYSSEIHLQDAKHKFNAKSIMGMMTLCAAKIDEIEVIAEGDDELAAVDHVEKFLKSAN